MMNDADDGHGDEDHDGEYGDHRLRQRPSK